MRNEYAGHELSDVRDAYDLSITTYTAYSQHVRQGTFRRSKKSKLDERESVVPGKALAYLAEGAVYFCRKLSSGLVRQIIHSLVCYCEIS
jgi:hypothetical protein